MTVPSALSRRYVNPPDEVDTGKRGELLNQERRERIARCRCGLRITVEVAGDDRPVRQKERQHVDGGLLGAGRGDGDTQQQARHEQGHSSSSDARRRAASHPHRITSKGVAFAFAAFVLALPLALPLLLSPPPSSFLLSSSSPPPVGPAPPLPPPPPLGPAAAALWVTVNVWLAIVMSPDRVAPVFGATLNVLEPLPRTVCARCNADPRHTAAGAPCASVPHRHGGVSGATSRADVEVAGADLEGAWRRSFLHHSNAIVVDDDLGLARGRLRIGSSAKRQLTTALPGRRRKVCDPTRLRRGGPPALWLGGDTDCTGSTGSADIRRSTEYRLTLRHCCCWPGCDRNRGRRFTPGDDQYGDHCQRHA